MKNILTTTLIRNSILFFISLVAIGNVSCSISKRIKKNNIVYAKIDQYVYDEIRQYIDDKNKSIYTIYNEEDESLNHSEKMFGRFASKVDIRYSELLEFNIDTDTEDPYFPTRNLSDTKYLTPYIFNKNQKPKITLKLDTTSTSQNDFDDNKSNPKYLLLETDTLVYPFKLSLINGFVKSEKTFRDYARVKEMNIYLNNQYKATARLLDTPEIQEFKVAFVFKKNDSVTLEPISIYEGEKHNQVCISEIQKNLGQIAYASIDYKYHYVYSARYQYGSSNGDIENSYGNYSYLGYDVKKEEETGGKFQFRSYYSNGRLAANVEFVGKDYYGEHLLNVLYYVDENGNELDSGTLKDGNGILKEYTPQGKLIKQITFKDGEIVE